jgi:dihydrodipicolinate synthase/N-acetylneuraminate lyase
MRIHGTWATLLLPIEPDESIAWSRLADEIDFLLTTGVDGIYSNGTAGEFYAQTEDEFDRVQEMLAARCRHRMPFQIGASHQCARTSIERVRRAARLRPAAIQVILPDWFPVSEGEARRFLEAAAEAADPAPLVLYNPPHAKRVLPAGEMGRLAAAVPALRGCKVAMRDAAWMAEVRALAPGFSIFVPGHLLASGVAAGADGAYSNLACLSPAGAAWWGRLIGSGPAAAREIESRIVTFFDDYILPCKARYGVANHALDKLLAAIGGWAEVGTRLRWPYTAVPESEAERLRPIALAARPELF